MNYGGLSFGPKYSGVENNLQCLEHIGQQLSHVCVQSSNFKQGLMCQLCVQKQDSGDKIVSLDQFISQYKDSIAMQNSVQNLQSNQNILQQEQENIQKVVQSFKQQFDEFIFDIQKKIKVFHEQDLNLAQNTRMQEKNILDQLDKLQSGKFQGGVSEAQMVVKGLFARVQFPSNSQMKIDNLGHDNLKKIERIVRKQGQFQQNIQQNTQKFMNDLRKYFNEIVVQVKNTSQRPGGDSVQSNNRGNFQKSNNGVGKANNNNNKFDTVGYHRDTSPVFNNTLHSQGGKNNVSNNNNNHLQQTTSPLGRYNMPTLHSHTNLHDISSYTIEKPVSMIGQQEDGDQSIGEEGKDKFELPKDIMVSKNKEKENIFDQDIKDKENNLNNNKEEEPKLDSKVRRNIYTKDKTDYDSLYNDQQQQRNSNKPADVQPFVLNKQGSGDNKNNLVQNNGNNNNIGNFKENNSNIMNNNNNNNGNNNNRDINLGQSNNFNNNNNNNNQGENWNQNNNQFTLGMNNQNQNQSQIQDLSPIRGKLANTIHSPQIGKNPFRNNGVSPKPRKIFSNDPHNNNTAFDFNDNSNPISRMKQKKDRSRNVSRSATPTNRSMMDGVNNFDVQMVREQFRTSYQGHKECVKDIVFIDSDKIASCSADGSIRIWDKHEGRFIATLEEHSGSVECMAYQMSNRILASGGIDQNIILWKPLPQWGSVGVLQGHESAITCLMFLSAQILFSGGGDKLCMWDIEQNQEFQDTPIKSLTLKGNISCMMLHQQDRCILAGVGKNIVVIHAKKFVAIKEVGAHEQPIQKLMCIKRKMDMPLILSCSMDKNIKIWDGNSLTQLKMIIESMPVYSINYVPGDDILITGLGGKQNNTLGKIGIWNLEQQRKMQNIEDNGSVTRQLLYDRINNQIFSCHANGCIEYHVYNPEKNITNKKQQ